MAVICSRCGREYDVTLFQFGARIRCDCGRIIPGAYHTIQERRDRGRGRRKERDRKR